MSSRPELVPDRIRGLVFDLDGTLIDSYGAIAVAINHARAGFDLPALDEGDVRRRVGRGLESLVAELVGPDRVPEGVRLFRERYAEVFATSTSAIPGALETLRELAGRGFRMSVASNKPARFGEPILERLGMRPFLAAVHGPDTAGSAKPDPTMVSLCVAAMGLTPSTSAYVGDMVLDVETAANAGLPVLLVPGGSSVTVDLEETGQILLRSIEDLLNILHGRAPARAGV